MTEKYECDKCGACCQGHLIVEADWVDLAREPRILEADRHRAGWPLEKALSDLEEPGRALLLAPGCRCPFLNGENHCDIYPTRPAVCVGLEAGDEQCQAARKEAGLDPLAPVSESKGTCECEKPGYYCSGVPGIIAHAEDGQVKADAGVERCDVCSRYQSDESAREKLIELGVISVEEAAKERYLVHCYPVLRVTLPVIAAHSHREATEEAIDVFDCKRDWSSAEFTDEFEGFLVDVVGDTEYAQSKYFDSELREY